MSNLSDKAKDLGERPIESFLTKNGDIAVLTEGMDIRTSLARDCYLELLRMNPKIGDKDPSKCVIALAMGAVEMADALLEQLVQ